MLLHNHFDKHCEISASRHMGLHHQRSRKLDLNLRRFKTSSSRTLLFLDSFSRSSRSTKDNCTVLVSIILFSPILAAQQGSSFKYVLRGSKWRCLALFLNIYVLAMGSVGQNGAPRRQQRGCIPLRQQMQKGGEKVPWLLHTW